jgi:hypothetical protein
MKITKERLKKIIKEEMDSLSYADELGTTEPRYDTGMRSPRAKLIHALAARARLDQMTDQQIEELAGGDQEVMQLIKDMMANKMLDNPRM